eukprot:s2282_g4.t1
MFLSDFSAPISRASTAASSSSGSGLSGLRGLRGRAGSNHRGLENDLGDNHCFLNVVIQAFWNLQSFRKLLLQAPWHEHGAEGEESDGSCCYCALKSLFDEFACSEADTIPPDSLRQALSSVYDAKGRFKTGDMEDATETIEAILGILHACNVQPVGLCQSPCDQHPSAEFVEEASNFGCHPLCLAHAVFGLQTVDLCRCSFCGATGEPDVAASYVYSAYVSELASLQEAPTSGWPDLLRRPQRPFAEILRKLCQPDAGQIRQGHLQRPDEGRNCGECNSRKTVLRERWLTRCPKTFILSLVWPSSNPSHDQLWSLLSMIQPQLRMDEIFRVEPGAQSDLYSFHGMICYCGMHYVALFWCPARKHWIFFDDMCVKEKEDWTAVVNLMTAGQYVPTLIFYENVSEEPALSESIEELTRQVDALEYQQSCALM